MLNRSATVPLKFSLARINEHSKALMDAVKKDAGGKKQTENQNVARREAEAMI